MIDFESSEINVIVILFSFYFYFSPKQENNTWVERFQKSI